MSGRAKDGRGLAMIGDMKACEISILLEKAICASAARQPPFRRYQQGPTDKRKAPNLLRLL